MKIKLTRQNIESALLYSIVIYLLLTYISAQIMLYRWRHADYYLKKTTDAAFEKSMDNLRKAIPGYSDLLKRTKNDTSTKN